MQIRSCSFLVKDTSPPDGKTAFQLAKDKNLDKIMSVLKAAGGGMFLF